MKRLHCQSDVTVEGKMFVAFFSLILRSYMQNKLSEYQTDKNMTFTSILKELNKLKYVCTADGRKQLTPITNKQRELLEACKYQAEEIPKWLSSLPGFGCIV